VPWLGFGTDSAAWAHQFIRYGYERDRFGLLEGAGVMRRPPEPYTRAAPPIGTDWRTVS
jgi:hypothetical protein